jgi:hypothetical protein
LNIHGVRNVEQTYLYSGSILPESNSFEVETTVGKKYKSKGTDQILAELMK